MAEQVKSIKFKQIGEDYEYNEELSRKSKSETVQLNVVSKRRVVKRQNDDGNFKSPNFTFEYSYPAIVFDNVCFKVDKSKQQANFIQGLIGRVQNSISCLLTEKQNRDQTVDILKSINLSVPYGSIFGLLGPSSCGKTTLLRLLVGLLEPSSGYIRLFCRPTCEKRSADGLCCRGSKQRGQRSTDCKVPGANVGYMPQDLGLYNDFTIRQLLTMFGQYMRMKSDLIETRIAFMSQFLDLPDVERVIGSLSGGQMRRVSFAIACLHMPPLIILDEPTVGVDPLLRQSIWKYLRRLADEENKTIIITTHYIEEAAQADQVALMRAGEILVQDTPRKIMESNDSKTLEEAFLKICNNVGRQKTKTDQLTDDPQGKNKRYKLYPQPKFNLQDNLGEDLSDFYSKSESEKSLRTENDNRSPIDKLSAYDSLFSNKTVELCLQHNTRLDETINRLSMAPNVISAIAQKPPKNEEATNVVDQKRDLFKGSQTDIYHCDEEDNDKPIKNDKYARLMKKIKEYLTLTFALLYKNYRRNVNSIPLLAFQFMLPMVQMISFSLCVGGRPTNIGLGLVNHDQSILLANGTESLLWSTEQPLYGNLTTPAVTDSEESYSPEDELLSLKYLSFIDQTMLTIKPYDNLKDALRDVRQTKLWAVMEIGENFTTSITRRFDLDNFYQLDLGTIKQSVIKLYPDRSNKVLDMICQRSIVNSYRSFLLDHFEHFKKLPMEVKEPIFDIKPNLISNSIDGYTESIAAGLLASLTYIMAAGLTTFIMVVERSAGILERTYTSGINPVAYLLAHAVFRSLVMMIQIAVVMFLTFFVLRQPLVGSLALAYVMLMTLNLTGISYGLLISSLVTDQNGAALTIVSSLVVKITMSGILWPFEAIPYWLRTICYVQPLTMPIQGLKAITLKGATLADRSVQLGLLVSITWLLVFLTISAKRFKFYQH